MGGEYTYLGWMVAIVENSLSHIGLPKKVLCFRPVKMSVALSKFNAAWPAWSQRNKKLEKEGPDSCLFLQPLLNLNVRVRTGRTHKKLFPISTCFFCLTFSLHTTWELVCLNSQCCCPIRWGRDGSLETQLCLIPPSPVPGKPIGHWTRQRHLSPCRSSRNISGITKREYSLIKCPLQCALWWHD